MSPEEKIKKLHLLVNELNNTDMKDRLKNIIEAIDKSIITTIPLTNQKILEFIDDLVKIDRDIDSEIETLMQEFSDDEHKQTLQNLQENLYKLQINTFLDKIGKKDWPNILDFLNKKIKMLNDINAEKLKTSETKGSNKYLKYKNKYLQYKKYLQY